MQFDFFGNALLALSTLLYGVIFSSVVLNKNRSASVKLMHASTGILAICIIYLSYQFLTDNFQFLYVFENSNTLLPVFYKFSALWSAHEGSFLLMIFMLALCGSVNSVIIKNDRDLQFSNAVLSFIAFFYLVFLSLTSNPFQVFPYLPANGVDLNPLLQDPLLIIHPPMLFFGYVFYAVVFSFVISGIFNKFNKGLIQILKVWSGIAWATLSVGILLGSMWAYYELGWGGYWFWDPVENVALLPWLAGTAFTHSLIFHKNKVLMSWMVFLGILAFLLSVMGSFIVRSGIINSVHAFASDPSRGVFLLSLFGLFSLASFAIFFWKSEKLSSAWPKINSKSYLILLNNIILMTILVVVFIGTLYPIFNEIWYGQKISIGPNYYSDLITPLVFLLILVFTYEQFFKQKFNYKYFLIIILLFAAYLVLHLFYEISFGLFAGYLFLGILLIRLGFFVYAKKPIAAHKIAGHLSVVALTTAILFNYEYSQKVDLVLKPNDSIQFMDTEIEFLGIEVVADQNFDSVVGNFQITSNDNVYQLASEKRVYKIGGVITSETGIKSLINRDFLIVLGDRFNDGSWSLRYSIKYGIMLIWLSSISLILSMLYGVVRRYE